MLKHKEHFHGSDLEKIEAVYGIKKETITSFSANVNPLGISPKMRATLIDKIDCITSYPDREYSALRKCIADYTGSVADHIVVGNGSTELISLFIQLVHPKKALILGPTYSEYERELSLEGGAVVYYPLQEADDFKLNTEHFCSTLNDSLDLVVICNPNNPTSTAITRESMSRILDACKRHNIYVMVDETYVEFAPDVEAVSSVALTKSYDNLVILRGISKFFASPGLRLGYAITGNTQLIQYINTHKNPWTINSLAAVAGELMFTDQEYIAKTWKLIDSERRRCFQEMQSWPSVKVFEPMGNFMLIKILKEDVDADDLFDHAIKRGLMIRNCSTFPYLSNKFFRFCFMSPEKNTELLNCLKELL